MVTISEAKELYNQLDAELKTLKEAKHLEQMLEDTLNPKATVGRPAPQFSAPDPEGNIISLRESMGKITIVDFWASWCVPCRKANKVLVKLYKKYGSKGLRIVGVSLDKDEDKWKQAIADDKLKWTQVSNLLFWDDPIAKIYNVQSIPSTFILDAEGNILTQDLHGDALKDIINELLKDNK